jgi:hypothetical protein
MPKALERKVEQLTAGTVEYSLVKYIVVMLKEHPDL